MDRSWYLRFLFVAALSLGAWFALWPSLDKWLPAPPAIAKAFEGRISPGLDIQGGLRLMYEVEVEEAVRDRRDLRADQLQRELGELLGVIPEGETPTREQIKAAGQRVSVKTEGDRRIVLDFKQPGEAAKLDHELITRYGDLREIERTGGRVELDIRTDFLDQIRETAVEQARETVGNRVDALGLREAAVTAQGSNIIVEVPGADQQAFQKIRDLISKTARLEFQIVDDEATFVDELTDLPEGIQKRSEVVSAGAAKAQVSSSFLVARGEGSRQRLLAYIETLRQAGTIPNDHEFLIGELAGSEDVEETPAAQREEAWRTYYLFGRAEVTGQSIEDAFVANDPQTNKPYVAVNFNDEGAGVFAELTGRNVKRRMAIVLDDRVASAPVIQTEIAGGRCQITLGGFRPYNEVLNEAQDLVVVLKAGALPVPIRPANEQMIGPSLGQDGVQQGVKGAAIGIVLVFAFMLLYYEVGGLVANIAVLINLLLLLSALAFFEATLTLPGLVAVALNIGMAVDANVLVNERIREELRGGKSPRSAVEQGFARAFWSIIDSQVTTFIAAVILFQYGTGPIKGFAVTLMIGICTSLFTGVFCSRVVFDWIVRGLRVQRLRVG
jgi:preprotein translocase subunit SecD